MASLSLGAACGESASPDGGAPTSAGSSGASSAVAGSNADRGGSGGTTTAAGAGGTGGIAGSAATVDACTVTPDAALPDAAVSDAGATPTDPSQVVTFHNGGFWSDAAGNRIEAHGAGLLEVDDTWYWIGEDKSANGAGFKAVNCYASKDLVHWELRNAIITRDTAPELAAADRIIERPKLIYNDTTKRYVMWLHWEGRNFAEAEAGVFSSDRVDGDYTYHKSFRPNGNMSRDDTLFKVSEYAFYVSDDQADWGTPATTGTFAATREPKLVSFAPRSGRYVRFVATREVNGREWTSIAELDLTGRKP